MRAAKVDLNQRAWTCETCGQCIPSPTAHQARQRYCSRSCAAIAYESRMIGDSNPNYKDAARKTCGWCGGDYHSYNKTRKYCGHNCYRQATAICWGLYSKYSKPKPQRAVAAPKTQPVRLTVCCAMCSAVFPVSPSHRRKFCSYECFIKSGGPQRAGDSAVMAKGKYGAKKDANHAEIFAEIQKHVPAMDLSPYGFGWPDGLANINDTLIFFDVKNPATAYGRRGLNERQQQFARQCGCKIYLIYSAEDARKFATGSFDGVKFFDGAA